MRGKIKIIWNYFWIVVYILFTSILFSSGIVAFIIPHHFVVTSGGSVPLAAKLICYGLGIFQVILGLWLFTKANKSHKRMILILIPIPIIIGFFNILWIVACMLFTSMLFLTIIRFLGHVFWG
jgi:hypothetical protein